MNTSRLAAEEEDKAKAWGIGDAYAHEADQWHHKSTMDSTESTKDDDGVHGHENDCDLDELQVVLDVFAEG